MPLGFERLNERSQRPNPNINFLKPLDTPDRATAQAFLERIAAQCYPVMKRNYISVMSLEEFPPNQEFLGRNFNAGECIQLVLKDKQGRWLSFNFVQMVMMHELAHCKQMNHSRAFWAVRNGYAEEMKELWRKKYSGEGLWGRGQDLNTGAFVHDRQPESQDIPEHLCGGTYRRARGKKRKRGAAEDKASDGQPQLTYAERQQRRIARRFGVHGDGNALGDDELVRGALESGPGKKRGQGKPKVAKSKRGRELRASAALARIEALHSQKAADSKTEKVNAVDDVKDEGSDTETEDEDSDSDPKIANIKHEVDIDEDSGFVRVCGDEGDDGGGQDEAQELRMLGDRAKMNVRTIPHDPAKKGDEPPDDGSETESEPALDEPLRGERSEKSSMEGDKAEQTNHRQEQAATSSSGTTCSVCTFGNSEGSLTCSACANVLKPNLMPNHWSCKSEQCSGSAYINAGDVGRCALCGSQQPVGNPPREKGPAGAYKPGERAMGATKAELLRWD